MKYFINEIVCMPPDEAAKHGDKLRLVDMKASKYRVEQNFEVKEKKVKRGPRKAADKG